MIVAQVSHSYLVLHSQNPGPQQCKHCLCACMCMWIPGLTYSAVWTCDAYFQQVIWLQRLFGLWFLRMEKYVMFSQPCLNEERIVRYSYFSGKHMHRAHDQRLHSYTLLKSTKGTL